MDHHLQRFCTICLTESGEQQCRVSVGLAGWRDTNPVREPLDAAGPAVVQPPTSCVTMLESQGRVGGQDLADIREAPVSGMGEPEVLEENGGLPDYTWIAQEKVA